VRWRDEEGVLLDGPLSPPLCAADAWDLAACANVAALRLTLSRGALDQLAAPVALELTRDYAALALAMGHGRGSA